MLRLVPLSHTHTVAGAYLSETTFHCLDHSLSIRRDQVNDDYCDCPDGSDEPGKYWD